MKRIVSILALMNIVVCISVYGQVSETTTSIDHKDDIVINFKMIEKYKNAEYSENQITFTDLFSNYSFETIKVIAQAYNNGELEITTIDEIDNYLAAKEKENNNVEPLELFSEKKILVTNE